MPWPASAICKANCVVINAVNNIDIENDGKTCTEGIPPYCTVGGK